MSDTIEFGALCPACGQDSTWSNGLQIVDYPAGREFALTTTCHCLCDIPRESSERATPAGRAAGGRRGDEEFPGGRRRLIQP